MGGLVGFWRAGLGGCWSPASLLRSLGPSREPSDSDPESMSSILGSPLAAMVGGGGGASSGAIAGENSGVSGMYVYVKTFEHDGALCRERSSVEQRKGDAGEE